MLGPHLLQFIEFHTCLSLQFLPQGLLQPTDFGRGVGLADTQHVRDLLVVVPVQVEQRPALYSAGPIFRSTHRRSCTSSDRLAVSSATSRRCSSPESDMPRSDALAAIERDRDVERDAVHPGGKPSALVEGAKGSPELDDDLLCQIVPVARGSGSTSCRPCRGSSCAPPPGIETVPVALPSSLPYYSREGVEKSHRT